MDNFQDKIAEIMSDPEAMKEIRSLGKMLGLGGNDPEPEPKPAPPANPLNMFPPETLGKLTALMPIISGASREDDSTRLLAALRPFLSEERKKKLETAKKMLIVMKLLPLLKNGGLFDLF